MRDPRLPGYSLVVPIEVTFRDLDAMGHVNNAVYLSYMEWARVKYWLSLTEKADVRDIGFIMARIEIDYISPARLCEKLLVGIRITELGRKSFTFDYRIAAEDPGQPSQTRLVARAESVQVLYDWRTERSMSISEELRGRIESVEGRSLPPSTR